MCTAYHPLHPQDPSDVLIILPSTEAERLRNQPKPPKKCIPFHEIFGCRELEIQKILRDYINKKDIKMNLMVPIGEGDNYASDGLVFRFVWNGSEKPLVMKGLSPERLKFAIEDGKIKCLRWYPTESEDGDDGDGDDKMHNDLEDLFEEKTDDKLVEEYQRYKLRRAQRMRQRDEEMIKKRNLEMWGEEKKKKSWINKERSKVKKFCERYTVQVVFDMEERARRRNRFAQKELAEKQQPKPAPRLILPQRNPNKRALEGEETQEPSKRVRVDYDLL